jgi:hypothetical protein
VPDFLSNIKQFGFSQRTFLENPQYQMLFISFRRGRADTCGQKDQPKDTDGQTEMKKVIGAFRDFVKAPEKAPTINYI